MKLSQKFKNHVKMVKSVLELSRFWIYTNDMSLRPLMLTNDQLTQLPAVYLAIQDPVVVIRNFLHPAARVILITHKFFEHVLCMAPIL